METEIIPEIANVFALTVGVGMLLFGTMTFGLTIARIIDSLFED